MNDSQEVLYVHVHVHESYKIMQHKEELNVYIYSVCMYSVCMYIVCTCIYVLHNGHIHMQTHVILSHFMDSSFETISAKVSHA